MTNSRDELKAQYPDIAKAYECIQLEQYELTGLWFRMNDKIQRLKQLVLLKKDAKVTTESVKDTFQDLSIYGIISQIVSNGNWK